MKNQPRFLKAERGIIIAADVPTLDNLRDLAELGSRIEEVVAIKVGFMLALRYGLPSVVKAVNEVSNIPIIYDHQKAATDIPAMGKPFASVCRNAGVQGVIFFPHAGPKTLEAFVMAALEEGLHPIVGLVMTHSAFLQSEGGFIADSAPDIICKIGIESGVRSFVLPGTKPDIVEKYAKGPLASVQPVNIMMPGIGAQGGSIMRAFKAAKGHFPHAIIGSAIYKSLDPSAVLEQFAAEVKS